jgi:hypothetical protein
MLYMEWYGNDIGIGGGMNSNGSTPLSSLSLRHSLMIGNHVHGGVSSMAINGVDELSPHLASLSLSLTGMHHFSPPSVFH